MQTPAVQGVTNIQMEGIWVFISLSPTIKHDLAKKLFIWLTMNTVNLTRPVMVFVPIDHFGIPNFGQIVGSSVHNMRSASNGAGIVILFKMISEFQLTYCSSNRGISSGYEVYLCPDKDRGEMKEIDLPTREFLEKNVHIQKWFSRSAQ